MKIKFTTNLPTCSWSTRLKGIYRITSDNGKFYIGSSLHLKQRSSSWKSVFEKGKINFNAGQNVLKEIPNIKEAYFEVIEYITDVSKIRDKESEYLMKHLDNPLFVNSAYVTRKAVVQYDLGYNKIAVYPSILETAKKNNVNPSRVQDVLTGRKKTHKGFIYRFDDVSTNIQSKKDKEIYDNKNDLRLNIVKELANGLEILELSKKLGISKRTATSILRTFRQTYKAKTTYHLIAILAKNGIV